jgi:uncharacterized protein
MHIVDRRLNPGGKSLANRQRFLRRIKGMAQRAVREAAADRDIRDLERGAEVSVPVGGVREPRFHRQPGTGRQDHVLPGNREFVEGDRISRPRGGRGGGGSQGGDGGGEDEFRFVLTREEFLDLFLDDLELPDLAKRRLTLTESVGLKRAGYTVSGSPSNLALTRTLRNSLARRIALNRPKVEEVAALEAEMRRLEESGDDPAGLADLRERWDLLRARGKRIPYIDPVDLRYRRFEPQPKPVAQAVMFCLMDVSGSMTEHMKDLAKRFFMLLHVFLARRYKHVDLVFIRHTDEASEVDEETFFGSRETGGTRVSAALAETRRVIAERYDPNDWNIYVAQASDGDNAGNDDAAVAGLIADLLPKCQYFAYLEVGDEGGHRAGFLDHVTTLWRTYNRLRGEGAPLVMRRVTHRREIYPVFRELFRRRAPGEAEAHP